MSEHVRPNYILIWAYLFVLTVIEVAAAFLSHIPKHWLIIILVVLAVVKALLVKAIAMTVVVTVGMLTVALRRRASDPAIA